MERNKKRIERNNEAELKSGSGMLNETKCLDGVTEELKSESELATEHRTEVSEILPSSNHGDNEWRVMSNDNNKYFEQVGIRHLYKYTSRVIDGLFLVVV